MSEQVRFVPRQRAAHANPLSLDVATTELAYAIQRHRAAWATASRRGAELAEQHGERMAKSFKETDKVYKDAMRDIAFWRAERASIAATVTALAARDVANQ